MNVAQSVRQVKAAHPERYCTNPRCLWRVETRHGRKPCPKHMSGVSEAKTAVQAGNLGDSSPRDVGRGASIPTAPLAAEREAYLRNADHRYCKCRKCGGTADV